MAFCTIMAARPEGLNKQEIKKLFDSDDEYVSSKVEIDLIVSQLLYLKQPQHVNVFAAKLTLERKYILFFSDGKIEVHCELVKKRDKYKGLMDQGARLIKDLERVLDKKIAVSQFMISDPEHDLICTLSEKNFKSYFKEYFTDSWVDRFVILLLPALVIFSKSEDGKALFKENWLAIMFYASTFFIWPVLKAIYKTTRHSDEKYKKDYVGI